MKKIVMNIKLSFIIILTASTSLFISCNNDNEKDEVVTTGTLDPAYAEFDPDETDIYLYGTNVVIETTGRPNHTTTYWGTSHPLYLSEPTVQMTAGGATLITGYDASGSLTVPQNPTFASSTTATSLNHVGIAVSGAAIFNDSEGNGPLSSAAGSLDWCGAHIGPSVYHYHLEPKAFSYDDENLVGVISDGFFIYGRKCHSTGTYPTDLDASHGHTSTTQHSTTAKYHYHVENEVYSTTGSYIVFKGPYKGTPNAFN
ncbi:YHYH protein [Flavobacterium sp. N2270]|uniref:YHYH protein n=1 Tax=Flavobacterium sp. N2270 TaxID=2986831 RepID=UPI002224E352|nr:YHYH protein [Flavobacterium sp. N2270]